MVIWVSLLDLNFHFYVFNCLGGVCIQSDCLTRRSINKDLKSAAILVNGAPECLGETERLGAPVCLGETECLGAPECLGETECLGALECLGETERGWKSSFQGSLKKIVLGCPVRYRVLCRFLTVSCRPIQNPHLQLLLKAFECGDIIFHLPFST